MPGSDGSPPGRSGAFFGRRKGKRLRAGQDELLRDGLPRLRLDPTTDLNGQFGRPMTSLWLEIGFGGGEHLAAQALAHPEIGFVGCEPFVNGIAKFLRTATETDIDNVRLWDRDATELLPRLPTGAIERAFLLYPDPWPKRRQRKRRFVSDQSLAELARIVRPGGEFRFATDIDDYAGWTLARILRSPDWRWTAARAEDWRKPWPDWPGTRYEAKALAQGRKPIYLTFRRTEAPKIR